MTRDRLFNLFGSPLRPKRNKASWGLILPLFLAIAMLLPISAAALADVTLKIEDGSIELQKSGDSLQYKQDGQELNQWTDYTGNLTIMRRFDIKASNSITVISGEHNVTFDSVKIDEQGQVSISDGATLNLTLKGDSSLKGQHGEAGLHVPSRATLIITAERKGGSLEVTNDSQGAGIGGNNGEAGGTVIIYGGTVKASSGSEGAGIGGGKNGAGGTVTIYGGTVEATGGNDGAGIGSGCGTENGAGGTVTIEGGRVTAKGNGNGAGIGGGGGGGYVGIGGKVTISGGTVKAIGSGDGAGIGAGGGGGNAGCDVTISGGTVTATGGSANGVAIGGINGNNNGTADVKPSSGFAANAWRGGEAPGKKFLTGSKSFTFNNNDGDFNYRYIKVDVYSSEIDPPTFDPPEGAYDSDQNVTLSGTEGAIIRYTTDGSDPDENSEVYSPSSPISVTKTTTVKARAYKDSKYSAVSEATYTIPPAVSVGSQTGTLTYGDNRANEATFSVSAKHFITPPTVDQYTVKWYETEDATEDIDAPLGINLEKISLDRLTASIESNAQAKDYFFKLTADNKTETATSGMVTLTVSPKPVTVTGIQALDKKYDGKTDATLDCSNAEIEGMVGSDLLTATATGTFADAYPETDKTVNISDIKLYLEGVETANYTADTRTSQTTAIASIYRPTRTVATPVITPKGASSINPWEVSITCPTLGATVYYTLDGSTPTSGSPVYEKPFRVERSLTVKARAMLSGWNQSAVASEEYVLTEPTKPYILHLDGTKEEFETITEALNAAVPGESVIVPGETELKGDLEVPFGVGLKLNNNVYSTPQNSGRLIIQKDGSVSTMPGEYIEVNADRKALSKSDGRHVYFTGIDISGTLISGGTLKLANVKATGDGLIDIVATGEITLDGEAAAGKVRLYEGRTVTLGESFTASEKVATILLGDDYELGRKVLTLANESQGKYAKYFALGDAPDDSWYIGEDGLLTCKVTPEESYLLLYKLTLGKGKKVNAANLLSLNFKGGVAWTSSDEAVFKIVGKGNKKSVKPLNVGTANLTAVFADGKTETIPVTVVEKKKAATGLTLKGKLTMKIGAIKTPKVTVTPASAEDKTLKWFTTDEKIAKVSETGAITAVSKGKCKVYAVTTAGARKVISVTVKK